MLLQTLKLLGNQWCDNPVFISRFMKGFFNQRPPRPRYTFTWPVSSVLEYLKTLFPLHDLTLKMLTLKLTALLALSSATRAQTLTFLNIDSMTICEDRVFFVFNDLLKTSRPSQSYTLNLYHNQDESICVMHTLLYYLEKTEDLRKSQYVLVSYCTYSRVTSSTVARWLKEVLRLSGIDCSLFKAHSYRGAASSAAFLGGCSLNEILKVADWSSVKNFKKYYLRESVNPKLRKAPDSNSVRFADAFMS